jgi:hypothetical protein
MPVTTKITGGNEVVIKTGLERFDGTRFDVENFPSQCEKFVVCWRFRQGAPSAV